MTAGLTEAQLRFIRWESLRSGSGMAETVGDDLRSLLFADAATADAAFSSLENAIVAQGCLFECAPAAVSVIAAAVTEDAIPEPNLPAALDQLGRALGGWPDPSEMSLGAVDLRERCREEARRAYWALMRVAVGRDAYGAWQLAREIVRILDADHSRSILGSE